MKKKILITCFEPFGGDSFNASAAVAAAMPAELAGYAVKKVTLPVEFGRAAAVAEASVPQAGAELILCFGEARSRSAVTPELVAINLKYAAIPDNAGAKPQDAAIAEGGAAAYFTPFPARRLAEGINAAGVPAALSYSAGAYVCNDLYCRLLRRFEGEMPVLFVHVPRMAEENGYKKVADAISAALCGLIEKKN
ncbi:MAG: pyroglutamyl-peptidase I [Clostridia bacterium]|nr:pyroglutamyl-peptidase I [Clostridia bacterium]